jgi:thioesterase domain-containing protein
VVGGAGGNVNNLVDLANALGQRRMVVGIQARGILGHSLHETIEEMAAENIRYVRRHQPAGPYVLAGYSAGAQIAFEMARQLMAGGEQVAEVILLDTYAPGFAATARSADPMSVPIEFTRKQQIRHEIHLLGEYGVRLLAERASAKISNFFLRGKGLELLALARPTHARSRRVALAWFAAARKYNGGPYAGPVSLVVSRAISLREKLFLEKHPYLGWDGFLDTANIARMNVDCGHLEMVKGKHAEDLSIFIEGRIRAAQGVT